MPGVGGHPAPVDPSEPSGVSVVVASRNRRDRLLESLDHLMAARPDEVIVVDNGSTDGTADALPGAFPQARVLRLGENRGSAARTIGVRAASHGVVAFADDDSWWEAGALHRAARHFGSHPRLGLVAARILVGPDRRLDPVSAEMAASPLPPPQPLPGRSVLGFVACGAVVRRTAYLGTGGFSEILFFFGEEDVVAFDLATAGWDLVYAPDVVAHHHPGARGDGTGRRALAARNDLLTLWLRRPLTRALAGTLALVPRTPVDPVARRALAGALPRLPPALRARRPVPRHVERAIKLVERAHHPRH